MSNKKNSYKQVVTLSELTNQAYRIVNNNAYSVYMIALGICSLFHFTLNLPLWVAGCISSIMAGYVYFCGSDYVDEKIGMWVEKMMEIRSEQTSEEGPSANKPIKESTIVQIKTTGSDRYKPFIVEITWKQLREIIEAGNRQDKLTRDCLSHDVWPNVDRLWRDGEIQRKAKQLGLVDSRMTFTWEWGGNNLLSSPEVENNMDSGKGVGG